MRAGTIEGAASCAMVKNESGESHITSVLQIEAPVVSAHSLKVASVALAVHSAPGRVTKRQNNGRSTCLTDDRLFSLMRAFVLARNMAVGFREQVAVGIRT